MALLSRIYWKPSAAVAAVSIQFPVLGKWKREVECLGWSACLVWSEIVHVMEDDADIAFVDFGQVPVIFLGGSHA